MAFSAIASSVGAAAAAAVALERPVSLVAHNHDAVGESGTSGASKHGFEADSCSCATASATDPATANAHAAPTETAATAPDVVRCVVRRADNPRCTDAHRPDGALV